MDGVIKMANTCKMENFTYGAPYNMICDTNTDITHNDVCVKQSDNAAKSTFVFYPYDLGVGVISANEMADIMKQMTTLTPTEGRNLFDSLPRTMVTGNWCLDYIFGRNVQYANSRVMLAPLDPKKFDFVKLNFAEYVEQCRKEKNASFPSDHFAVVTDLCFN